MSSFFHISCCMESVIFSQVKFSRLEVWLSSVSGDLEWPSRLLRFRLLLCSCTSCILTASHLRSLRLILLTCRSRFSGVAPFWILVVALEVFQDPVLINVFITICRSRGRVARSCCRWLHGILESRYCYGLQSVEEHDVGGMSGEGTHENSPS